MTLGERSGRRAAGERRKRNTTNRKEERGTNRCRAFGCHTWLGLGGWTETTFRESVMLGRGMTCGVQMKACVSGIGHGP